MAMRSNTLPPSRGWTFTSFDVESLIDLDSIEDLKYGVYQLESAPETGRLHLQGYLQFGKPKRMTALKKIDGLSDAHLEAAKGTPEQNTKYCTKEETRVDGPWTFGRFTTQGKRTDIDGLKDLIRSGASDLEIFEQSPLEYLRYGGAISRAKLLYVQPREHPTELIVIIGATGLGKTSYVLENAPGSYWKNRSNWWDGYDGKADVVFDDFYGWVKYDDLLRWINPAPAFVEIKGGTINFAPKRLWITSNHPPHRWYKSISDQSSLFRRISEIQTWNLVDGSPEICIHRTTGDSILDKDLLAFEKFKRCSNCSNYSP